MDCSLIPECTYTSFSRGLHGAAGRLRLPIQGSLELTARCNLGCAHCYIVGARRSAEIELTTLEVYRLLDELAEEGCLWLCLTGGEPLMRKDLWDIYLYAKTKGFLVTLFTNGTLIDHQAVEILAESPPFSIEVSLYGMSEETYLRLTGLTGAFDMAMQGIHLLLQRGLPLKLKTCLLTVNKHEFQDMKRFAQDHHISFRYDYFINPRIDGSLAPAHLRLSPEEVVAFELADEERATALRQWGEQHQGLPVSDKVYNCGAGYASFYITAQGKLQLCVMAEEPTYDLRQGTFRDGFYQVFPGLLSQRVSLSSRCRNCGVAFFCNRCPGWASKEVSAPGMPIDYCCQIAHSLAMVFAPKEVVLHGRG